MIIVNTASSGLWYVQREAGRVVVEVRESRAMRALDHIIEKGMVLKNRIVEKGMLARKAWQEMNDDDRWTWEIIGMHLMLIGAFAWAQMTDNRQMAIGAACMLVLLRSYLLRETIWHKIDHLADAYIRPIG